jgi:hypothetical protein
MAVCAVLAAGRFVSISHGLGMMPEVVEVHVFGIKPVRCAGGAEEPVPVLILAVEDLGQGVHENTHWINLTQKKIAPKRQKKNSAELKFVTFPSTGAWLRATQRMKCENMPMAMTSAFMLHLLTPWRLRRGRDWSAFGSHDPKYHTVLTQQN